MNKKFSTLVAGLLLATSVGTANAQAYASVTTLGGATKAIVSGKYYQLQYGTSTLLTMEGSNGDYHLEAKVVGTTTKLPNTLWKVVSSPNAEGGVSFTFVNVATGMPLGFDPTDAVKAPATTGPTIGSSVASKVAGSTVWKWQPAVSSTSDLAAVGLTTAFTSDSVMTLVAGTTGATAATVITAVKAALGNAAIFTSQVALMPVEAKAVLLGVDDLNSMLWSQNPSADASKTKLTFEREVAGTTLGNLFSSKAYKAVPAVGFPADNRTVAAPQTAVANYSALQTADLALAQANAQLTLVNAVRDAVMTDGKVDAAKKGLAVTALTAIAGGHVAITADTDVADIVTEVETLVTATDVTSLAVEAAVVAYVNSLTLVEAQKIAAGATAGVAYVLYNTEMADAAWADNAVLATVDARIKLTYVDKATTGTVATLAARNTALAAAKTAFTTTAATNGWISLMDTKATDAKDNTYLAVDTKFLTADGGDVSRNLALAVKKFADVGVCDWTKTAAAADCDAARLDLNGRYNFQFQYYPTEDSLVIRTGGWAKKLDTQDRWEDMNATTNTDMAAANMEDAGTEFNLIKLAVLAVGHREVTVGSSELKSGATPESTINTRIYLDYNRTDDRTTLASGLYFLNLQTEKAGRKAENNGFKIAKLTAEQFGATAQVKYAVEEESQKFNTVQNYGYMPAAQWVVEKIAGGEAGKERVNIYNREYPSISLKNIQLYTDGKGNIALPYATGDHFDTPTAEPDTLKFTEVKTVKPAVTKAYTDTYLGYWQIDSTMLAEKMFKLDYLSGMQLGNYVNVLDSQTDSVIRVDLKGVHTMFAIETVPVKAEGFFGYDGNLAKGANRLFPQLRRTAYVLKVRDANKLEHNNKYVKSITTTSTGEPLYVVATIAKDAAQKFFFKENNRVVIENENKVTETPYFAFVETTTPSHQLADTLYSENVNRIGVKDASLLLSKEEYNETRVAAFAFAHDNTPLYRRFDTELESDEAKDMPVTMKFFRANNPKEFLYENGTKGNDPVNAYGVKGINFLGMINEAQFIEKDDRSYSIYVDTAYVRNQTIMPQYLLAVRPEVVVADTIWCKDGTHANLADSLSCIHTKVYPSFTRAQYLINAQDSVAGAKNGRSYLWQDYTRLAFVDAAHYNDTLFILRGANAGIATANINFNKIPAADKVALYKNAVGGHNNVKFSFRLIDDSKKFLIESKGDRIIPTGTTGGWVKYHNGVPVIAQNMTFAEAIRQAEIFDVTKDTKFAPTDNETIGTTEVSVIAGNGSVTINNAAGKTVAISNILGQTIAQTVLSSDNATVSVPAGIVVVSVEGEAAVKAIVK